MCLTQDTDKKLVRQGKHLGIAAASSKQQNLLNHATRALHTMIKHFEAIAASIFNGRFTAINKGREFNAIMSHCAPIIRPLQSTL